jgi:hypothetical protein
MIRRVLRLALLSAAATLPTGCGLVDLGPWGGPAYSLDIDKIGTGQQAITPRNDTSNWNGESTDTRTRR